MRHHLHQFHHSRYKLGTVGPAFLGYLLFSSAQLPTPKQSANFIITVRILRVRLHLLLGRPAIIITYNYLSLFDIEYPERQLQLRQPVPTPAATGAF